MAVQPAGMKVNSLRSLFLTATLLLVDYSADAAESVPPPSAFALADAMQVVETSRVVMQARTQAGITQGRNSSKELECWKSADFTPVRAIYAEAFARVLTGAEIEEATAFLASPLGSKVVQFMNAESLKARGWPSASEPMLTEDETQAAMKFLSTGVGSKLYSNELQSPELQKRMVDSLLPMFQKCMEPRSTERRLADLDASMTPEERARSAQSAADKTRPSEAEAVKLIRAMREDEFFLANLRDGMNDDTRPVSNVQKACIEGLKPADVSGVMSVAVQDRLSAAEVKDAIEFFESAPGRKFTQLRLENVERPISLADFTKVLTVEEAQSFRKFFTLSASRKLMQDKVIEEPASIQRISQRVRELADSCRRQSEGKR